MTASEFAFLALGLVLGVASGSALVMVLGSRAPAREVRLTVEHDAVPRRAATLSTDGFHTSPAEPARGGPADRRRLDRDSPPADPPAPAPYPGIVVARPRTPIGVMARTPVRSGTPVAPTGVMAIAPDRDPSVDALRIQAAIAAERLSNAGRPTATALLEAHAMERLHEADRATEGPGSGQEAAAAAEGAGEAAPLDETPALTRMLRGDQRALEGVAVALAGPDAAEVSAWRSALLRLTQALAARATEAGWLDFPIGNPFWDTFTTEQCRAIAGALSASGHRFDGDAGWADGRVPTYRDLTIAVAATGMEPRRIRAWPTQEEIGGLYREVTPATDEFVAHDAPTLDIEEVQALIVADAASLTVLFGDWERVRRALLGPIATA